MPFEFRIFATKGFSAEKIKKKKGVIPVNYTKPEITKLAEATVAICSEDSLIKMFVGLDSSNPHRQTNPAYFAEE